MKKITDNVVEDIPGSLFTCFYNGQEVRLWACSPEYVELRSADRLASPCRSLHFSCYRGSTGYYETIEIADMQDISMIQEKELPFSCLRTEDNSCKAWSMILHIENAAYKDMFQFVTKQYYNYILLRSESHDNTFSRELVGYPADRDNCYANSYEEWRRERLEHSQIKEIRSNVISSGLELVQSLDNQEAYQAYLNQSNMENDTCVGNRLYIGNQYCHNLFPDRSTLQALLDKAYNEHREVTLVTTYLRQSMIQQIKDWLQDVYEWCIAHDFPMEVIVNDWGMFSLLEGKEKYLTPVIGLLLNKRRKDPRYVYKTGYQQNLSQMADNQLNQTLFVRYLQEKGVQRAEYEACGYPMELSRGLPYKTLHLPMYQTNTSQYCPLYALCRNGNRARQHFVTECPQYCKDYVCLYPRHLNLVGRYNSLFALDEGITQELLAQYIRQGVDRIVWNL